MSTAAMYNELAPTIRILPNGLTVALERLPHVHTASVGIWIKTGSANETAEVAGISHFLEHLFFKGTTTRTARELMDAIESKGGQLNAFTGREYTCLYAKVLTRHIGGAIDVLADILNNSIFADMEKERNVILEEIASTYDVPDEYVHDLLTEQAWPEHPLGRPIAGFEQTVEAISLDDIKKYKALWYRPETIIVSVAGNFDEDEILDRIANDFSEVTCEGTPEFAAMPAYQAGIEIVERTYTQDHLAFAFPGVSLLDDKRFAFEMLSSILGGGSTSRLFDRIREEEGLAYSIYSFNSGYAQAGMIGFYAAMAPENLAKTLELSFEELRKLRDEPLSAEELESNAEQLKGSLLMALENTFNRMARMARSLMFFDRVVPVDEILDRIDAVTAPDIQRLSADVFKADQCTLTVLGPRPAADVAIAL